MEEKYKEIIKNSILAINSTSLHERMIYLMKMQTLILDLQNKLTFEKELDAEVKKEVGAEFGILRQQIKERNL